jgi:glycosyltransferase involved in cell wall biosynthesis
MFSEKVYLIGPRYQHHSSHSGYEGFHRHIGTPLKPPINSRFMTGYWGWRVDTTITRLTPRPNYSLGLLLIEGTAALHMLTHGKSLYHVLYGDTDVWLLGYVKRLTGNRLVATFHEPPRNLEWLKIDKIAHNLDAVIVLSESQRQFFNKLLPAERIFVVPHGIDTDFFKPAEGLSEKHICITVGSHLRDFETLKLAITPILKENPHLHFFAVGARQPGGNNSHLYDERFEFLDNLSDEELLRIYRMSRIAIFPFQNATASNSLLEAMACGLPIVATDIGGVREYVGDEAGILCKPRDPGLLANAISQLLNNPSLANQMSNAGRARALEFDYRAVAKKMEKVYSDVLRMDSL